MKRFGWIIGFILIAATLGAFFTSGCIGTARMKVGYIEINDILNNWQKYKDYLELKRKEGEKLFQEIPLDPDKRSMQDRKKLKDKTVELAAKEEALLKEFVEEVRKASEKIAREKKLTLVMVDAGIEYGGVDITEDIKKNMGKN